MDYKKPVILKLHPFQFCRLCDAAIAYALDLANGDIEDEHEVIDVEYEEISSTNERPLALPDNQ